MASTSWKRASTWKTIRQRRVWRPTPKCGLGAVRAFGMSSVFCVCDGARLCPAQRDQPQRDPVRRVASNFFSLPASANLLRLVGGPTQSRSGLAAFHRYTGARLCPTDQPQRDPVRRAAPDSFSLHSLTSLLRLVGGPTQPRSGLAALRAWGRGRSRIGNAVWKSIVSGWISGCCDWSEDRHSRAPVFGCCDWRRAPSRAPAQCYAGLGAASASR